MAIGLAFTFIFLWKIAPCKYKQPAYIHMSVEEEYEMLDFCGKMKHQHLPPIEYRDFQ